MRSGFVKLGDESDVDSRFERAKNNKFFVGLQGSQEMIKWFWTRQFSTVAGDNIVLVS